MKNITFPSTKVPSQKGSLPLHVKLLFEPYNETSIFLKFTSYIVLPSVMLLFTYLSDYDMLSIDMLNQFSVKTLISNKDYFIFYVVFIAIAVSLITPIITMIKKEARTPKQWLKTVNTALLIDMSVLTIMTFGSILTDNFLGAAYISVFMIRSYVASTLLENSQFRTKIMSNKVAQEYILSSENILFWEIAVIVVIHVSVVLIFSDLYFLRFLLTYQIGALSLRFIKRLSPLRSA